MTRTLVLGVFIAIAAITGCAKTTGAPHTESAATVGDARSIIVARVNGAPLFMDRLVQMMNRMGEQDKNEPVADRTMRALNGLVLRELAYQRAQAEGLRIDEKKIELALANLKDNLGGKQEYADYLTRSGLTESDIRHEVERALTIELIYAQEVMGVIAVPEEEVKKEYEKEKNKLIKPERMIVTDVNVLNPELQTAKTKAGQLRALVQATPGQDPWKLVLDGTFSVRKRVLRRDQDQDLYKAGLKLSPGSLSEVVETPTGVHVIKLESYSQEAVMTLEEARPQLEAKLKTPYQDKKTQEWEQGLKKGAAVEIVEPAMLN